jgi:hypothetical protein
MRAFNTLSYPPKDEMHMRLRQRCRLALRRRRRMCSGGTEGSEDGAVGRATNGRCLGDDEASANRVYDVFELVQEQRLLGRAYLGPDLLQKVREDLVEEGRVFLEVLMKTKNIK